MELVWAIALTSHLGLHGDYNEIHPHVRFVEDGAIAGVYFNSMERLSLYAGHRIESGNAGLELALTTGYQEFGPIAPHVRGTYNLGDNTRVFVGSAFEKKNSDVNFGAIIGLEFKFN